MKYKNEQQIMKALEITSWRNLSKDHMVRFAGMMPDMDTEVALKIVEQFPEFNGFALDALDVMEKRHDSTLSYNKQSQDAVHRAFQAIREILKGELDKDELTADERKYILEMIMETGNREFAKDSENKRFLESLFTKAAMTVGAAIALGVVFVGGKAILESGGMDDVIDI